MESQPFVDPAEMNDKLTPRQNELIRELEAVTAETTLRILFAGVRSIDG